jgi:hypothetical protein
VGRSVTVLRASFVVIQICRKADAATLRIGWIYELAYGRENRRDGLVMVGELLINPRFELGEPASQFLIRGEQPA